ncbi:MAG: hypothetical protein LAT57_06135 [Balneolales bacterium]|nr:hypothetical protein [Balneolales bacterium]
MSLTNNVTRYVLLLAVFSLLLSACNTPKKALNRGEYERAVRMSVDKLRSSPGNRSAREVLVKAWPLAIDLHENRIAMYENSNERFRFEQVVESYEQLNSLTERVQRCPACLDLVDVRGFYIDELNESKEKAAEVRYEAGIASLDPNNRERSREAYEHFMVVERMMPDYRDTRERMNEALSYATLHVIVNVPPLQQRSLSVSHEFFHHKVVEYLQNHRRMSEYVQFYYPDEAQAEGITQPDQQVYLTFDEFMVGQTRMESSTETVSSTDSVKVGEVTLENGDKMDVYNIVQARLTKHRKTVVSNGIMDMRIQDAWSGRVILQEKIPGEFVWVSEWANFNGDERALNEDQLRLTKFREAPTPPNQDLFVAFTGPIYDQVTDRLRRFYSGY